MQPPGFSESWFIVLVNSWKRSTKANECIYTYTGSTQTMEIPSTHVSGLAACHPRPSWLLMGTI